MGKRPRKTNEMIGEVVVDELEYTKNKCSDNARMIVMASEKVEFNIWFDKHYHNREQHGDDDGKRAGIEPNVVEELIRNAAKHLIFYSIKVKGFSFVNFEESNRPERILITFKIENEINLNVIAEYHYLELNKYEVTVKTAMRKDAFHFSDGQYQVQMDQDGSSILFRKEKGKIKTIDSYM
jgi:hypothetical protein